jgi:hypothetical protein
MKKSTILCIALNCMVIGFFIGFAVIGNHIMSKDKQFKEKTIIQKREIKKRCNVKLYTRCLFGELYYDWKDRPQGVCIPVLNNEGNIKKCNENSKDCK